MRIGENREGKRAEKMHHSRDWFLGRVCFCPCQSGPAPCTSALGDRAQLGEGSREPAGFKQRMAELWACLSLLSAWVPPRGTQRELGEGHLPPSYAM